MTSSISLSKVQYIPKVLEPRVLYVSETFRTAAHLCLCGCGEKVVTPLGPAKWNFREDDGKASLWPSIGNWQLPCRSHYVIKRGNIIWAEEWTEAEVDAGRKRERDTLESYYRSRTAPGFWASIWQTLIKLFSK